MLHTQEQAIPCMRVSQEPLACSECCRPRRWPSDLHMHFRRFWTEVRGVHDLACLQRFANFARVYPRYRDLRWLDVFMPQWDSAIQRLIAHDM